MVLLSSLADRQSGSRLANKLVHQSFDSTGPLACSVSPISIPRSASGPLESEPEMGLFNNHKITQPVVVTELVARSLVGELCEFC